MPPATHSGGLRYHGMAPMVSHLTDIGAIEAKAYGQKECFDAGVQFANAEGIVPAPEATHAVKGAIDAALECKKNVEKICRKICRTKKTQKIWSGNALQKALPGGAKKSFKNGPGRRPKRDVFQSLLQGMPGAFQAPCGPEHHEQLAARTRTNDNDNDNDNGPSLKAFALK